MRKKYLALTRISCFEHYSNEEVDDNTYSAKWASLQQEIKSLLEKYDSQFVSHETIFVNKTKQSVCQCDECGHWLIDRERNPAGIDNNCGDQIHNGATHQGKNLCEMCLPGDHRWGIDTSAYA